MPDMFKAAVTGTNGKTSVVHIAAQLMTFCGLKAASLGTLGLNSDDYSDPNPVLVGPGAIKEIAEELENIHAIDGLYFEAFSTSIDAGLYDNVDIDVAALTNISLDHLDYHGSSEQYVTAKIRLFETILSPGKRAVINHDDKVSKRIMEICAGRSIETMSFGVHDNAHIRLVSMRDVDGDETEVTIEYKKQLYETRLAFIGHIFVQNWLCALSILLVQGHEIEQLIAASEYTGLPPGRLEKVCDRNIYIDYAHNAEALKIVLDILKCRCSGRLHLVFGCGGDRDNGKRRDMGRIANLHADAIYITDDNPRTENARNIRYEILRHCPRGFAIGNREEAIQMAIDSMKQDDCLLVAGKGHETYQEVSDVRYDYSDRKSILKYC